MELNKTNKRVLKLFCRASDDQRKRMTRTLQEQIDNLNLLMSEMYKNDRRME